MTPATGTDDATLASLRRWNLGLILLHALQAVLVLVLAGDFAISVVETFPEGPPGTTPPQAEALFDVGIGYAVAAFLLLAALDHGLTATLARRVYERDLRAGSTSATCGPGSTGSAGWSTPSAPR